MNRKVFWKISIIICLLLGLSSQETFAQDNQENDDYDKFRLSLGWFNPRADTTIRLDATDSDLGTTLKLEDDVGLSKGNGLFRVDGFFRFKRRHRIDFGYYDFDRNGSQTISGEINFGDQVFPVNATVNSFFNLLIIKVSYTYLVVAKRNTTVGLSIGFNFSDLGSGLNAVNLPISQTTSSNAPLPMFGVNATHNLGSNFWVEAHVQYFYIDLDSHDGSIFDARVAINYRIKKNFGIGIGYNVFIIKANKQKPDFTGRFKLNFDGVQLFASLFF